MSGTNGNGNYEISANLEWWRNDDLVSFVLDNETMMGLEKHHIIRFAQELAMRFEPFMFVEDVEDEEDEDEGDGRFHGREHNG